MWGKRRDSTRLELGSDHLPVGMIAAAVGVLAAIVFGVAYFNRTPYGAVVTPPRDAEVAFKEYLAKNEPRMIGEYTFFNCAGFWESMFSGDQELAAAFELRGMRQLPEQDLSTMRPLTEEGDVAFVAGRKPKDGEWTVISKRANVKYPLALDAAVDVGHPCSLSPGLKP